MMKILVTGASGFIGSNLVQILKKAHDVSVLDARQVTSQDSAWRDQVDRCDVLIHLAGRAHVTTKNADSSIYQEINTDLTTTLATQLALNNKMDQNIALINLVSPLAVLSGDLSSI